jgi:hypothetical protein
MAEASRKRVFLCIAPLSAAFWISAHVGATPALAMYRDAAEHSLLQWHVAADGLEHPDRKGARRMLSAAIERGIYSPPALNPDSWETPARRLEAGSVSTDEFPKVPGRVELESCVSGHEYAVLKGFIITRRTAGSYEPHALDLSSPDGGYRFQIVPLPRTDLVTLTRRKDLANAGFMVVIPLWLLDSTGYKLSGLVEERGPDGGVQRVTKVKLNSCRNLPMFR